MRFQGLKWAKWAILLHMLSMGVNIDLLVTGIDSDSKGSKYSKYFTIKLQAALQHG
jgi:hypothetical protein